MAETNAIRAGRAYVELFADQTKLQRGLKQAQSAVKEFAENIQEIGDKIKAVGLATAGLGTAILAPMAGAAKVFADAGSKLADMAERTGLSVEALSGLAFAADQSATDVETLEVGIRKMQQALVKSGEDAQASADAFDKLGMDVAVLQKLSPEDQFLTLADRLSKVTDAAQKTSLAIAIFGKQGAQLVPLINEGRDGITALTDRARELGLVMDGETAKKAKKLGDEMSAAWAVLKNVAVTVGAALAPALTSLARFVQDNVAGFTDWLKANKQLVIQVGMLAIGLTAVGAAIYGVGTAISAVGSIISGVATVYSAVIGATKAVIGFASSLATVSSALGPMGLAIVAAGAAVTALATYFYLTSDSGQKMAASLKSAFGEIKTDATDTWTAITAALSAGDLGAAARAGLAFVKLEWVQLSVFVRGTWASVADFVIGLWDDIAAAARATVEAIGGILAGLTTGKIQEAAGITEKNIRAIKADRDRAAKEREADAAAYRARLEGEVADARKAFDQAISEAKAAKPRELGRTSPAAAGEPPVADKVAQRLNLITRGTFNPAEASRLAFGPASSLDKIEKNTARTATEVGSLRQVWEQNAANAGLVFE